MADIVGDAALRFTNRVIPETAMRKVQGQIDQLKGGMEKLCFAPSELMGKVIAEGFGIIAEKFIFFAIIEPEILKKGINPSDTYLDYSFVGPIDQRYVNFLTDRNPVLRMNPAWLEIQKTPLRRPDLLIHNRDYAELYEIKPDSRSGVEAARVKKREIDEYVKQLNLPYTWGESIQPKDYHWGDTTVRIGPLFFPIRLYFRVRLVAGVFYYKLCIEADWKALLGVITLLAFMEVVISEIQKAIDPIKSRFQKIFDWLDENKEEIAGGVIVGGFIIALIILFPPSAGVLIPATVGSGLLIYSPDPPPDQRPVFF